MPVDTFPHVGPSASSALENAFPDRLPIGIDSDGRAVFMYLVVPAVRNDLRGLLRYDHLSPLAVTLDAICEQPPTELQPVPATPAPLHLGARDRASPAEAEIKKSFNERSDSRNEAGLLGAQ